MIELDARGMRCPWPAIRLARAMRAGCPPLGAHDAEFFEKGDKVVVLCRLITRSRRDGTTIDHPMAQVITARDGKITEFRPFYWEVPRYRAAAYGDEA